MIRHEGKDLIVNGSTLASLYFPNQSAAHTAAIWIMESVIQDAVKRVNIPAKEGFVWAIVNIANDTRVVKVAAQTGSLSPAKALAVADCWNSAMQEPVFYQEFQSGIKKAFNAKNYDVSGFKQSDGITYAMVRRLA